MQHQIADYTMAYDGRYVNTAPPIAAADLDLILLCHKNVLEL